MQPNFYLPDYGPSEAFMTYGETLGMSLTLMIFEMTFLSLIYPIFFYLKTNTLTRFVLLPFIVTLCTFIVLRYSLTPITTSTFFTQEHVTSTVNNIEVISVITALIIPVIIGYPLHKYILKKSANR